MSSKMADLEEFFGGFALFLFKVFGYTSTGCTRWIATVLIFALFAATTAVFTFAYVKGEEDSTVYIRLILWFSGAVVYQSTKNVLRTYLPKLLYFAGDVDGGYEKMRARFRVYGRFFFILSIVFSLLNVGLIVTGRLPKALKAGESGYVEMGMMILPFFPVGVMSCALWIMVLPLLIIRGLGHDLVKVMRSSARDEPIVVEMSGVGLEEKNPGSSSTAALMEMTRWREMLPEFPTMDSMSRVLYCVARGRTAMRECEENLRVSCLALVGGMGTAGAGYCISALARPTSLTWGVIFSCYAIGILFQIAQVTKAWNEVIPAMLGNHTYQHIMEHHASNIGLLAHSSGIVDTFHIAGLPVTRVTVARLGYLLFTVVVFTSIRDAVM